MGIVDAELIAALDDLVKAEEAASSGDEGAEDWFYQASCHAAYRWTEYKRNPIKPATGPFQTGLKFRLNEDGTSDVESI
jgi:hypothetical protein